MFAFWRFKKQTMEACHFLKKTCSTKLITLKPKINVYIGMSEYEKSENLNSAYYLAVTYLYRRLFVLLRKFIFEASFVSTASRRHRSASALPCKLQVLVAVTIYIYLL